MGTNREGAPAWTSWSCPSCSFLPTRHQPIQKHELGRVVVGRDGIGWRRRTARGPGIQPKQKPRNSHESIRVSPPIRGNLGRSVEGKRRRSAPGGGVPGRVVRTRRPVRTVAHRALFSIGRSHRAWLFSRFSSGARLALLQIDPARLPDRPRGSELIGSGFLCWANWMVVVTRQVTISGKVIILRFN
jgi:hypothetical protein